MWDTRGTLNFYKDSLLVINFPMKETILIVEDEKDIVKMLDYNLKKEGYKILVAHDGEDALDAANVKYPDLILLDLMLPGVDGLEVCKQLKLERKTAAIPVIMLTAKTQESDKVVGLELGADDYVTKPFSPRELILRVKAILKRGKPQEEEKDILSVDKITIDIPRHKVTVDKKEIKLTQLEFRLLVTLVKRRGRVQSRDGLLEDVWDIASEVTTRTIDTHIKRLREKLGKAGKLIETIRGIGYRFNEGD